jgi:quercetin dioxygenase-like cupin family protein
MPVIHVDTVPVEGFHDGATYQTLVGDDAGTTPVRLGLQVSPPGFSTGAHQHPYMEIVTVIEGEGEAWIEGEGDPVPIGPGATMVFQPNVRHSFTVTGDIPMKTYGVHASPDRIVQRDTAEES